MSTPPSISAGELRRGCTSITASRNALCPKSSSASMSTGYSNPVLPCSAALTTCSMRPIPGKNGRQPAVFRTGPPGVRPGYAGPGILARCGQGSGDRRPRPLLPRRRSHPGAGGPLAQRRPAALYQLAELLRLPDDPVGSEAAVIFLAPHLRARSRSAGGCTLASPEGHPALARSPFTHRHPKGARAQARAGGGSKSESVPSRDTGFPRGGCAATVCTKYVPPAPVLTLRPWE